LIEIEGDGCCDTDGRKEGVGASIVSCGDKPPILEFGVQILDFVALAAKRLVVVERRLPAFGWRDAGFGSALFQRLAEPVAVIASIFRSGPPLVTTA
jgi:hypothetical protein